MNKELLQNWVRQGLAVEDLGDGQWSWTRLAKRCLPDLTRHLLTNLLYNQKVPSHVIRNITNYGFSKDGFVLTDED